MWNFPFQSNLWRYTCLDVFTHTLWLCIFCIFCLRTLNLPLPATKCEWSELYVSRSYPFRAYLQHQLLETKPNFLIWNSQNTHYVLQVCMSHNGALPMMLSEQLHILHVCFDTAVHLALKVTEQNFSGFTLFTEKWLAACQPEKHSLASISAEEKMK